MAGEQGPGWDLPWVSEPAAYTGPPTPSPERTRGRSMSTCIPSPGPMWATWLKLVGLDIILDLNSGSLSISLGKGNVLRFRNT